MRHPGRHLEHVSLPLDNEVPSPLAAAAVAWEGKGKLWDPGGDEPEDQAFRGGYSTADHLSIGIHKASGPLDRFRYRGAVAMRGLR